MTLKAPKGKSGKKILLPNASSNTLSLTGRTCLRMGMQSILELPAPTPPPTITRSWDAAFGCSSVQKGRRLRRKTHPSSTAYANVVPLGTRAEQLARKKSNIGIRQANKKAALEADRHALRIMSSNVGTLNERIEARRIDTAEYDFVYADNIHASHSIRPVKNEPNAFYCYKCSAWSSGGPLKCLLKPCSGVIPAYRAFQNRLLRAGVIPIRGAKLPLKAKVRFHR